MKIENARVISVSEVATGQGTNGEWKKQTFVVDTGGQYPKQICFTAMGKTVDYSSNLKTGQMVDVDFDISSREYNGKWYTDAKAFKITPLSATVSGAAAEAVNPEPNAGGGDGLPF